MEEIEEWAVASDCAQEELSTDLVMPITQQLYDALMAGERHEVYLHLTKKWILRLVEGVSDQRAWELSWQENRGLLHCTLMMRRLHLRLFRTVRLVAPLRTAIYDLDRITLEQTPDARHDVFVVHLGKLIRITRHFG